MKTENWEPVHLLGLCVPLKGLDFKSNFSGSCKRQLLFKFPDKNEDHFSPSGKCSRHSPHRNRCYKKTRILLQDEIVSLKSRKQYMDSKMQNGASDSTVSSFKKYLATRINASSFLTIRGCVATHLCGYVAL